MVVAVVAITHRESMCSTIRKGMFDVTYCVQVKMSIVSVEEPPPPTPPPLSISKQLYLTKNIYY